jgi:hypothetical protein
MKTVTRSLPPSPELLRALPVDVEQHVAAGQQCGLHGRARRAVEMIEHPGMLEELAAPDHAAEGCGVDELVVDAVLLAGPARPRRRRDAQLDLLVIVEELPRQSRLAGARGRRQDEHQAAPLDLAGIHLIRHSGPAPACAPRRP